MPSYTIKNTMDTTVATIGVATTTGTQFPIELVGQGISLYGPIIATTQYKLLENFTSPTPPANPVKGQLWYDPAIDGSDVMSYYNGTQFVPLSSVNTNSAAQAETLPSATNIDLSVAGDTPIYTDPNDGSTFHATGLLLKVNGQPTATTPALVNLMVNNSEDVLENVSVMLPDSDRHAYYVIQGTTHVCSGGDSISLQVSSPVTDGDLKVDAYLFGFQT